MKLELIVTLLILIAGFFVVSCSSSSDNAARQLTNINSQPPNANTIASNKTDALSNPVSQTKETITNVSTSQSVKIGDILNNPKSFDSKTVTVEGVIVSECGSGCWFTLKDGAAVIYIDLAPSNLVIPQKKGSRARVTATVVNEGSDVYLIGKKVEF